MIRFCRFLGIPDEQIHLTSQQSGSDGKGPVAERLGITHMVDNDCECLSSVLQCAQTMKMCILFTGLNPDFARQVFRLTGTTLRLRVRLLGSLKHTVALVRDHRLHRPHQLHRLHRAASAVTAGY